MYYKHLFRIKSNYMDFRKDINGLRAFAVISVVLFHFNSAWLPGGFAGVDVFFVISGFLMTGIIFRGIEEENFSILKFYIARANRIVPALAVLCFILVVFGWFYIFPHDYKALGTHVGSSISFFSNIVYWQESGYFDVSSHNKWLLHTWSLSVEWQFYIIYPLIIVLLYKFLSLKSIKVIIIIGAIIGFVFSILATYKWPNAAYYLLPTRAWEMMVGGIAYLYPFTIKKKKHVEWIGVALIFSSYFFISKDNQWPGYLAIFPVLGAFLIIQADRKDSIITNNIVFQKLGTWSYSIYLWHWPLVVAIYYFSLGSLFIYLGIVISILLGFLSYKYIERIKFKNNFNSLSSYLRCMPIYIVVLLSVSGFWIFKAEPNNYLYPLPQSIYDSIQRGTYECFDKPYDSLKNDFCKVTNPSNKRLFVTGDSHAYSVLPVLEKISKERDIELTYGGYGGCPPLAKVYSSRPDQHIKDCHLLNKITIKHIVDSKYDYALLAARWTYYTEGDYLGNKIQYLLSNKSEEANRVNSIKAFKEGIEATFKIYSQTETKVLVMLQTPMQELKPLDIYYNSYDGKGLVQNLLNRQSISIAKHTEFQSMTNEIIINEAKKYSNIIVINPMKHMCVDAVCPAGNQLNSYYFDEDHLSLIGSYQLKDALEKYIKTNKVKSET